jgi:hypothetical protein
MFRRTDAAGRRSSSAVAEGLGASLSGAGVGTAAKGATVVRGDAG